MRFLEQIECIVNNNVLRIIGERLQNVFSKEELMQNTDIKTEIKQ
jgi:hypothetical protein